MVFSFFKKREKKATLALDIGTEWIKALLFEKGNPGKVLAYKKVRQKLGETYGGGVTDLMSVAKSCKQILDILEEEANVDAKEVILGIAGETVRGATDKVYYQRSNPEEPITLTELKAIIHSMQSKAFANIRADLAEELGIREIDIKLVNAAIVQMKIDNYQVVNPLGFKGHFIEMMVFNAFAPLPHIASMHSIADMLDLELLSVMVEPYAVSRAITHEDSGNLSAILMDIGGGTTDVAIVQNGACVAVKMIALGGRAFTKRIANTMGCSFMEAEKMKIAYSKNELEEPLKSNVKEIIEQDINTWLAGVEMMLEEIDIVETLPSKFMICGGGAMLPDINEAIKKYKWNEKLRFGGGDIKVMEMKPEYVDSVEHSLKNIQDVTPLALANLAQKITFEESVLDKVMERVARVIR